MNRRIQRRSGLVPVLNALVPPSRARRDPSRVFDRLAAAAAGQVRADRALRRVCGGAGVEAALGEADAADWRYLVAAYAQAEALTRLGWAMVIEDLRARIANQLRVQALHRAIGAIGTERIERPIVIVGLPRTGTTLVHKLLAAAPAHRAPTLAELMHTTTGLWPGERRAVERRVERMMRTGAALAPAMRLIHPQHAEAPDEDHLLLPHGLQHPARVLMPAYARWCLGRDYTRDYDYLLAAYQVLQYGAEARRWVIKAPCHLLNLDQVARIFPGATIVWLHRDPITVLGSMCSLAETAQGLHVRRVDLAGIGDLCLEQLAAWVSRARHARGALREQGVTIVDVSYQDLVSDPHVKMPRLYDRVGAAWSEAQTARLGALLARPSARHEYAPERYGLDGDRVEAAFGDYARHESLLCL